MKNRQTPFLYILLPYFCRVFCSLSYLFAYQPRLYNFCRHWLGPCPKLGSRHHTSTTMACSNRLWPGGRQMGRSTRAVLLRQLAQQVCGGGQGLMWQADGRQARAVLLRQLAQQVWGGEGLTWQADKDLGVLERL